MAESQAAGEPRSFMPSYYVVEFIREFKEVGEERFKQLHDVCHLVGMGIAGDIAQREAQRTATVKAQELQERGIWLDRVFPIRPQAGALEIVVGRSPESNILIPDHTISRRHCVFSINKSSYAIADLGGANGTLVNKAKVGQQRVVLTGGEEIVLGRLAFSFLTPDGFRSLVKSGSIRQAW
ncbi:MAG: FHA domain-containing protein [Myxococcales bacterium]